VDVVSSSGYLCNWCYFVFKYLFESYFEKYQPLESSLMYHIRWKHTLRQHVCLVYKLYRYLGDFVCVCVCARL